MELDRLRGLTDAEIEKAVQSDPDAAPILDDEWFAKAKVVLPRKKTPVSVRVDQDVVDWFKAQGARYQTRINAVLRAYMEAHK
jgi:uncharacterized protein (DUF4415 family)